jgi:hypothetical protein
MTWSRPFDDPIPLPKGPPSPAPVARRAAARMTNRLHYRTTAKIFHWLIVALLFVQYPIGWLMPDIHRGMKPGTR